MTNSFPEDFQFLMVNLCIALHASQREDFKAQYTASLAPLYENSRRKKENGPF